MTANQGKKRNLPKSDRNSPLAPASLRLSPTEREILERMAKPGHYEPYAPTMNDYPTPTHTELAARGLIQWAKAPRSSVEWEITDAGRQTIKAKRK